MKDQMHFNSIGKNASNVFYVNQDKKDQMKLEAKGGSRKLAEDLRTHNEQNHQKRYQSMRDQAEQRKKELQDYEEAEKKNKQDLIDKKLNLRKVQNLDAQAKKDFKNRQSEMSKKDDFDEQNILSYVYQAK